MPWPWTYLNLDDEPDDEPHVVPWTQKELEAIIRLGMKENQMGNPDTVESARTVENSGPCVQHATVRISYDDGSVREVIVKDVGQATMSIDFNGAIVQADFGFMAATFTMNEFPAEPVRPISPERVKY